MITIGLPVFVGPGYNLYGAPVPRRIFRECPQIERKLKRGGHENRLSLGRRWSSRFRTDSVQPEIEGVRTLDFRKIKEVFLQAAPAVDLLRKKLEGVFVEQGYQV